MTTFRKMRLRREFQVPSKQAEQRS